MLRASMAYRILHQNQGLGLAMSGSVFINMLYGPPTVALLEEIIRVQRKEMTHARHAILTIIDPRVGKEMPAAARQRAREISNEMEPHTMCNCFIVVGTGFFAAMVRSVVAGIQLFSKQKHPWKVTSGLDEAVPWLTELLATEGKAIDTDDLRAAATAIMGGGR